jgi:hypothetical protein
MAFFNANFPNPQHDAGDDAEGCMIMCEEGAACYFGQSFNQFWLTNRNLIKPGWMF